VGIEIPVKIWQFHKYVTLWHYVIDPLMMSVNNNVWKSFTKQDRAIIQQAAIEASYWEKSQVRKGLVAPDLSALEILKKHGMEVTVLTPAQRAEFKKLTKSIYKKWVPKIGKKLVKEAEKAVNYK